MTSTFSAVNPAELNVVDEFPAISQEAAGLLKIVWRLSEIEDDWSKGASIHPAWDRWTYWPYMAKLLGLRRRRQFRPHVQPAEPEEVRTAHFVRVDYPNLTVRQAWYDEGSRRLAITVCAGQDASPLGAPTQLTISNLRGSPRVLLDGRETDAFNDNGSGTIVIDPTVGEHTLVVSH